MKFTKVIIESRYAPSFPRPNHDHDGPCSMRDESCLASVRWYDELARNLAYARLAMRDCLMRDEAPYASHLLYTQEGVLNDTVPEERERGMLAGFAFRDAVAASIVYVDLGLSRGMIAGIQDAITKGRALWFRSMPNWAKGDSSSTALTPAEAVRLLPELRAHLVGVAS